MRMVLRGGVLGFHGMCGIEVMGGLVCGGK